jgi:endonuclease YncB( thermonuclease family)
MSKLMYVFLTVRRVLNQNLNMNKTLVSIIIFLTLVVISIGLKEGNWLQNLGLSDTYKPTNTSAKTTYNGSKDGIERSQVRRVVDGDTVELSNGQKIRMLNIDTPETVKANTAVKCYGPEASAFTKKLLSDKMVQLVVDREANDQYGRGLRFIFLDGVDTSNIENSVNADVVKNGFGKMVSYKPNTTYARDFQKWEDEARSKKLGVWGACKNPFVE